MENVSWISNILPFDILCVPINIIAWGFPTNKPGRRDIVRLCAPVWPLLVSSCGWSHGVRNCCRRLPRLFAPGSSTADSAGATDGAHAEAGGSVEHAEIEAAKNMFESGIHYVNRVQIFSFVLLTVGKDYQR